MAVKSKSITTELTGAEEQADLKWLGDVAASASSESEQAIQAKNALRIIKVWEVVLKLNDKIIKIQDGTIKRQDDIIKLKDDTIAALMDDAPHATA